MQCFIHTAPQGPRPEREAGTVTCSGTRALQSHPFTKRTTSTRRTKYTRRWDRTSSTRVAGIPKPRDASAGETDRSYQECGNFLRSIGIENRAEIARVLDIATNPKSLFHAQTDGKRSGNPSARSLSVKEDLEPLLKFLLSQGFSQEEVAKLVVEYPAVLCYSPEGRLRPFFDYLKGLGIAQPDRTVLQRPSLLGLTADKNLRQMVEYLQQNDYTIEQIEQMLATTL